MKRWQTGILWAIVAAVVALLALSKSSDPDIGFHLATGRAVLSTGRVPAVNVLSFTEPDHPWILQQWLPAILFELAWQKAGAAGLLAVKIPIVVATWCLVFATALRLGASAPVAAPVVLWGAWAASFRFSERPLIFSNLFLAALAYLLARLAALPPEARPGTRNALLAGAIGVAALACHFHAGAVFLDVLLFAVGVGCALDPLRARLFGALPGAGFSFKHTVALGAVAIAGLALAGITLSLYHPYGLRVLTVPLLMEGDSYLAEHLIEFRPVWRTPMRDQIAFWTLLPTVTVALMLSVRRVSTAWSAPAAVFAYMALKHIRLIDAFALVSVPMLAARITDLTSGVAPRSLARVQALALAAVCLAAPIDHFSSFLFGVGVDPRVWPLDLFAFVRRERLHGPAFVSDGWAGLWLGVFYPHERAFFDNRFDAYSPHFYREVYPGVRYGRPGWSEVLDRYAVTLAVLKYTSPGERRYQHGAPNLRQLLVRDPRWVLVYFDDFGEVFVRRASFGAAQVDALGIPGVDPDRGEMLVGDPEVRRSLVRAIARLPSSRRSRGFAAGLPPQ